MNAIKKLSPVEKRKLERRLPLWEDAYRSAEKSDRKMLIEKIENARKLLLMEPFIKKEIKVKENKPNRTRRNKTIKLKEEKRKRSEAMGVPGYIKSRYISKDEIKPLAKKIINLFNNEGLNDTAISRTIGKSRAWISRFRNENIDLVYSIKKNGKLTPEKYIELRESGLYDKEIRKIYDIHQDTLARIKRDNIIIKHELIENVNYNSEYKYLVPRILKELNEKDKLNELINMLELNESTIYGLKKKTIRSYYVIIESNKLTPEKYIKHVCEDGLPDYKIAKMYNIDKNTVMNFKAKNIVIKYRLKNK